MGQESGRTGEASPEAGWRGAEAFSPEMESVREETEQGREFR
ncbi:MAG: hypothetical protein ACUVTV_09430 [Anaerolineae bacterium]